MKMKHWTINGLLTLATILAFLLTAEIIARFVVAMPSPYPLGRSLLVWDQRGFWINEPNATDIFDNRVDFQNRKMTIDANGGRAVPCRSGKSPTARKLILIGDSETFGWGLSDDETWPNRLQCRLNDAGIDTAVYNIGVAGTNLDQYYFRIRHVAEALKPGDMVVFMVTWNDFHTEQTDNFPPLTPLSCNQGEALPPIVDAIFPTCLSKPLRREQQSATWRRSLYDRTGLFIPTFGGLKSFADSAPFSSAIAHILIPKIRMIYYAARENHTLKKVGSREFESNGKIMNRIGEFFSAKDISLHFLFLPSKHSTDDPLYAVFSKNGSVFPEQDFLFHYAQPICERWRLSCASLFNALHNADVHKNSFVFDGHLNPHGANVLAEWLSKWLPLEN